ncbi:hypothetical protein HD806DRAFT_131583 [Xylariaceae sp. AK1471]|nr:hypothetical protein HD806DRAFT_131583 [Xylariaceae sp. AK1471]
MSSSGHDDEPSPERLARGLVGVGALTNSRRVKKKRVRNFTEDDRAAHRIFEKSRREAFKEALTNLASLLPALADTEPQRLSKHVVVDESITFIKSQHEQINTITEHLEAVKTERDELLAEINHWRSGAGIEPRQINTVDQPTVHHGNTSATSEAILGTVPTVLQSTDPPIPILGELTPSFITNPLRESDPTSLSTDSTAGMPWESYESQIHAFGPHPSHVQGETGPSNNNIGSPDPRQISTFQTPQSPNISQFNIDRGQEAVFMSFEPPQSFNPSGFQTDTFMQNTVPLQDHIPP